METSPTKLPDAEYLNYVRNIVDQCLDHAAQWKIGENELAKVEVLLEKAVLAYKANTELTTKNRATAKAKKYAFQALKEAMNWFITYLVQNLSVPDQALDEMKIRARHHHASPAPAPTQKGNVKHSVRGAKHRFSLNLQTDNQTRKVSVDPNGTGGTEWRFRYKGETNIDTKRSSKSSILTEFKEEDWGKIIEVSARWVNSKLEPGPWSDWIEVIIT
jgi:hypothetical protein